jgi:sugar-specific transcriptional regulator TrmB
MTSIFEAYDQEFSNLSAEIQRNINELKSYPNNSDKASGTIRHIEGLLSQANDLIKQMNVEVRSQDPATRKILTEKLNHYVKTMSSTKSDFERVKEQSQRSALIGERSAADRQRLLDSNAM